MSPGETPEDHLWSRVSLGSVQCRANYETTHRTTALETPWGYRGPLKSRRKLGEMGPQRRDPALTAGTSHALVSPGHQEGQGQI